MTRGVTRSAIGELATIVLSVVLLSSLLGAGKCAPRRRNDLRTLRLCSKDLSDALYLVCRDRGGFNEPFSYSGEDEPRRAPGPGLVEECCHHSCSIDQLQQYCKLTSEEKSADCQEVMKEKEEVEESLIILNLPYSSVGIELTPEERLRSRIDHAGSAKKS